MPTNDGAWDKHKYKAREWVKGTWRYIYDTAKKTTDKAKETAKEVSFKVSNLKDNTKDSISKSKDYISNKFENTKNAAEKIIDSKINNKKDESINATYYKQDIETYRDTSKVYKYKYTDLIQDIMKENPIPTSIGIGLSILTGTTIPALLGIGIADTIIDNKNRENKLKAKLKANREVYEEQNRKDEESQRDIRDKINNIKTVEDFKNLTDEEKLVFKQKDLFTYSIWDAKADDRPSQAVEMSDDEEAKKASENNPGYWENIYDENNNYDENCWICTLAYGEQRKGNEVYPDDELDEHGNKYEMFNEDIFSLYDDPKVINFGDEYNGYDSDDQKKIVNTMLDTYPDGSYGAMNVQWLFGGGHSLFWEISNGEVIIRDTQNDEIYYQEGSSNNGTYYNEYITDVESLLSYTWNCQIFRTDNVDLKSETNKYLKDKPDVKLSNDIEKRKDYYDMSNNDFDYEQYLLDLLSNW